MRKLIKHLCCPWTLNKGWTEREFQRGRGELKHTWVIKMELENLPPEWLLEHGLKNRKSAPRSSRSWDPEITATENTTQMSSIPAGSIEMEGRQVVCNEVVLSHTLWFPDVSERCGERCKCFPWWKTHDRRPKESWCCGQREDKQLSNETTISWDLYDFLQLRTFWQKAPQIEGDNQRQVWRYRRCQ